MKPANYNIVHAQTYSYKDNLTFAAFLSKVKQTKSISDFLPTSKALHKPSGSWFPTSNKFAEDGDVWRWLRTPDLKAFLDCPH